MGEADAIENGRPRRVPDEGASAIPESNGTASATPSPRVRSVVVEASDASGFDLARRLQKREDFLVVGEASGPAEALAAIREHEPEALFVGLGPADDESAGFLDDLPRARSFSLVVVASDDAHAARAFEARAIDYLVAPWDPARLAETAARVRRYTEWPDSPARPGNGGTGRPPARDRYVTVKQGRAYRLVDLEDVRWAEAARNYVRVHTAEGDFLVRTTLSGLEERLASLDFVRIHRGTIVRVSRVRRIVPLEWGDCTVELDTGERLRMSRTYRSNLLD